MYEVLCKLSYLLSQEFFQVNNVISIYKGGNFFFLVLDMLLFFFCQGIIDYFLETDL